MEGSSFLVTESLPIHRATIFKKLRSVIVERMVWTVNGKVYMSLPKKKKIVSTNVEEMHSASTLERDQNLREQRCNKRGIKIV